MDMKITSQQMEILEKVIDMEIVGDDPCMNKGKKKELMKTIKKTMTIPQEWWYEIIETLGTKICDLPRKEQRLMTPIYNNFAHDIPTPREK